MILIDTNVILDVVTNDPFWVDCSRSSLEMAAIAGPLMINDIIYAEVSVRFASIEAHEAALAGLDLRVVSIPRDALFLAGKAFRQYSAKGGTRTGVLPDFFIGAHATVLGCALVTRDARRYRTYFPTIRLIVPG